MVKNIKIAVAVPTVVINKGLAAILKKIHGLHTDVFELYNIELLKKIIITQIPDIVIISTELLFVTGLQNFKKQFINEKIKLVILQGVYDNHLIAKNFDESVSIFDSEYEIKKKIVNLVSMPPKEQDENNLSVREKEIIVEVVKGLTNKEIANKLNLSVHTIITHRRNISAKLQIRSTAGLTIYAISNKLIEVLNG
jgi:DNA-binding CsgD family transcriptional regulator